MRRLPHSTPLLGWSSSRAPEESGPGASGRTHPRSSPDSYLGEVRMEGKHSMLDVDRVKGKGRTFAKREARCEGLRLCDTARTKIRK
jgi:hypothetical protein